MRVLVTGAGGFVGRTLCNLLESSGHTVRAAERSARAPGANVSEVVTVGEIGGTTDWAAALACVDAVIHTAARVHVLHDAPASSEAYLETNTRGTQRLAAAAAHSGVKRLIYLSSIKVNGEETLDRPFTAQDPPNPQDAYGASKLLAEQHLAEIAASSDMEVAVVRPPLVYGPGVRANFLRLLEWVDRGIPLPLGAIRNQRSLVNVWNLCDLLRHLLSASLLPGSVWLVSDGEDLSTPELIGKIAHAMHRKARLVSLWPELLDLGGRLTGHRAEVRRLCSSLVVDAAPTRSSLGWSPPVTVDAALTRTVAWYTTREPRRRR